MIFDETANRPEVGVQAALHDLLARAAARRPNAIAICDPPNRADFTGGSARRLTYAEADRAVTAIAARLGRMGLATGSIVAFQLPNSVESILTFLAILRAGLIAVPLPLLWRRAECEAALNRLGAKALIACARIGKTDHAALAMQVAAKVFPIKYVCCFGAGLPDGVMPMDDLLDAQPESFAIEDDPRDDPANRIAVVTWDVTDEGLVPVARNHKELLAGGIAAMFEGGMAQDAAIVSAIPAHSFAGIALSMVPWLLTGGTLVLHHPFESEVFAAQIAAHRCQLAILPGAVVERLVEARILDAEHGLRSILGVWRAPERLTSAPAWRRSDIALVDVQIFGETGFVAARRGEDGKPAPLRSGPVLAGRDPADAGPVIELMRGEAGTIALRGPMVPRHAFPPGAERGTAPYFKAGAHGFVDTGNPCRLENGVVVVTGPPAGIVSVGGYRFVMRDLQALIAGIEQGRMLTALPDAFAGHRLAGNAREHDSLCDVLADLGVNPLVIRAFRARAAEQSALSAQTSAVLLTQR